MEITRNTLTTNPGPPDWFAGTVSWGEHVTDEDYGKAPAIDA
jgi:hypothetical protein